MRVLRKGIFLLLPLLVVGGLWMVAEDREQNARLEHHLRYVPGRLAVDPGKLPGSGTLVDASAEFLKSLIPATL